MSNKTTKPTKPTKTTKITVTEKIAIGTMREYFVLEAGDSVVYALTGAAATNTLINHMNLDAEQVQQIWSDIDDVGQAVVNRVG